MPVDAKQYIEELAQTNALDPESKAALLKVLEGNPKFSQEFAAGVSRQADYSRNMDALNVDKRKVAEDSVRQREWYESATRTDAERTAYLEAVKAKYGDIDLNGGGSGSGNGGGNGGNGNGSGSLTRAEFDKILKEKMDAQAQQYLGIAKTSAKLASRHAAEFHEMLDVDEVEKIAVAKNISVEAAYQEFISPRLSEKDKLAREAELKAAREEGARDALARHSLPTEAGPKGHHAFFDRKPADKVPADERGRMDSFIEAFNKAGTKP